MGTETIISTILSNAGFAGALLIAVGWAYWKKDRSEKATQVALVKQAEKHTEQITELQKAHAEQLTTLAEKRTEDAHRVLKEIQDLTKEQNQVLSQVAVTNADVASTLTEVRRDIRDRNNKDKEETL